MTDADLDSEEEYDQSDSDSEIEDSNFADISIKIMLHHLFSNQVASTSKQYLRRTTSALF